MRVLVTGASGFVGQTLCHELQARGHEILAAVRTTGTAPRGVDSTTIGEINSATEWGTALRGKDVVVHLAARPDAEIDPSKPELAQYREVNVQGTLRLAEAAVDASVRQLISMSTVKVLGRRDGALLLRVGDRPNPQSAYAWSKLEAENLVLAMSGSLKTTIIRAPLFYGPGVHGNFLRLMQATAIGLILPLGGIDNRRSMLAVSNLADLVADSIIDPSPESNLVLAADNECLSTTELVQTIGEGLGTPARLVPAPQRALRGLGGMTRKSAQIERLLNSLEVTTGSTSPAFQWSAPTSARVSIRKTANAWMAAREAATGSSATMNR